MRKIIILVIFLIPVIVYAQQPDAFITIEEIKNISVFDFASDEVCAKLLNIGNVRILKDVLYLGILASVSNINNHRTTRTIIPDTQYRYRYIYINDLLEYETLEKDLYRYGYDPKHPDAIPEGDMRGFVKYPDINPYVEEENINKIMNILFIIK